MKTTVLPASVSVGHTDLGLLSLGDLGRGRRTLAQPLQVTWGNGPTYLVGPGVELHAAPIERLDFARLATGPELQALTYGACGQLLGPGHYQAVAVAAFPVEVLADTAQAQPLLRAFTRWFKARHEFTVDGAQTTLDITDVLALAQPAGSYFAWGCNDAGQWLRSASDLQGLVGVCDIGFNTADVFSVQAGQIIGRYTGGDTLGLRRAAEHIRQTVRQQYAVQLSLHQADAFLRQRQPLLHTAGQTVDLTPLVQQARASTAGALHAFLESRWGNGRQFAHLLFTGGGAAALQTELLAQFPYGVLLPDPVTANAVGLARYARRKYPQAELVLGLDPGFGAVKLAASGSTW